MPHPVRAISGVSFHHAGADVQRSRPGYRLLQKCTRRCRNHAHAWPGRQDMHADNLESETPVIFVSDEFPGMICAQLPVPRTLFISSCYTENWMRPFNQLLLRAPRLTCHLPIFGETVRKITDPFGHQWALRSTSRTSLPMK